MILCHLNPLLKCSSLDTDSYIEQTEREIMFRLDAMHIPSDHPGRLQRKAIIEQAQRMLATVDIFAATDAPREDTASTVSRASSSVTSQPTTSPITDPSPRSPALSQNSPLTSTSISPGLSHGAAREASGFPFQEKRSTVIRRKAPPPPKKTIAATALYDFEPEEGSQEELGFKVCVRSSYLRQTPSGIISNTLKSRRVLISVS